MTKTLHLCLAQLNPIVGDLRGNAAKILKVRKEAPAACDLIVYPEMAVCGYPPEDLVLKPFFLDQVDSAVENLTEATRARGPALLVPAPWRHRGKVYNAAHLIRDGKIIATRCKHRLPSYGVFDEHRIFTAARLQDPVDFNGIRLGIMICEDMWAPEAAAHLRDKGAEILIVPNGSPFDANKNDIRLDFARQRTAETGLPLAYVNQVGGQDELVFDGGSFVMNAEGVFLLQGDQFEEKTYAVTLKENARGQWFAAEQIAPACGDLEAVYRALALGLRDYITKNGFPGVLLGLSGGIDSALSAVIAADALGPESVRAVMMPSRYTAQESLEDAAELVDNLGIHLDTIPIEGPIKAFHEILSPHFTEGTPGVTFENIQPRSRGLILMALSNATGHMVLSTGNKSETAIGYTTLYGDMCGGFNVLKDIYKTQVYELARWRNARKPKNALGPEGLLIPERILTRAPTAELRENQRDQDTLPPYGELDDILACLIERDMGLEAIIERGHDRETVARVWRMLDRAEYKRRQAPPGIKITSRAFGRDRRYPITNHFAAGFGD